MIIKSVQRRDTRQGERSIILEMVQSKPRFERQFVREIEAVLCVCTESGAGFIAQSRCVTRRRFSELIVDCVEAKDEHVIAKRSKIRNVCVRVKLPAFKAVIRNLYFAIEKREALPGEKATPIRKLSFQLNRRDVS